MSEQTLTEPSAMEEITADEIAAAGTPAYAYDLAELDASHALLTSFLPQPSELYYSLKANPHPAIVRRLHALGCEAEVTSGGELASAFEAGVTPEEILYTGPGKRDEDIDHALAEGVRRFSVDSAEGMRQLDDIAGSRGVRVRALLRVNPERPIPGVGLAMTGAPSQFGADLRWIEAEPEHFRGHANVEVEGLHLYLATNLHDEDTLTDQFAVAIDAAVRVQRRLGIPLRTLDLGGGFGAPYAREGELPSFPTLAERLKQLIGEAFPDWQSGRPRIAFESGRFLTATCGRLITRVLDVKESQGRQIVVCESGINHLGGMAGLRRVPPIRPDVTTPQDDGEATDAMVSGPLCTPLDTWARQAEVPAGLRRGDLAVVRNVGAYGLSASLALFLGHPLPDEVVTDGPHVLERGRLEIHRTHTPRTPTPDPAPTTRR
ncbi:type III PLP-dependent enzyme [Actinomadura barringtoniae]|uniref:Type III PLP-dependent enzyme n=1 Tax=Actinomadura barringtoniae TaxID=1427535 RepID=A0A939PJD5_9ACTN|nr:type III PLP-dependent enzyme [Actinomadura barringtoniae]MBO2450274.1 type III PLP-dependent enzyme [Actinomadura barringtoniae]